MGEPIKAKIANGSATFTAGGEIVKGDIVKFSSTSGAVETCDGANDRAVGVADAAAADGADVTVTLVGGSEVTLGGTIASPGPFKTDASGHAVSANSNLDLSVGYIIEAGVSGDVVACIVLPNDISNA